MAAPKLALLLLPLLLLLLLLLQPTLTAATPTSPAPAPPAPLAPGTSSAPPAPLAPVTSPARYHPVVVLGPPVKERPAKTKTTPSTGGKSNSKFGKWRTNTILVISIPPAIVLFLYSVLEVLRERYPETFTFRLRDQPGEGNRKLYTTIAILGSYVIGTAVSIYEMIDALKH